MNKFDSITIYDNISDCYYDLIQELLLQKPLENGTKEIFNCRFAIKNPTLNNICMWPKKMSLNYLIHELEWYWSGSNSTQEIGKYAKLWLKITDDGETANSAYGYIINKKYSYNQLEQIIMLLWTDKNTRRAVLNISDPKLNKIMTNDYQCTISIQFVIRDDELFEIVNMRSNDINYGFPYDYSYFISLGLYVAKKLKINFGMYIHNAASMHMYLKDEQMFINNLKETENKQKININWEKVINDVYNKH